MAIYICVALNDTDVLEAVPIEAADDVAIASEATRLHDRTPIAPVLRYG